MAPSLLVSSILVLLGCWSNIAWGKDVKTWLSSPELTKSGTWGADAFCSPNTFVTSFQLKAQRNKTSTDALGLTGIRLYCTSEGNELNATKIHSLEGDGGSWGGIFACSGGGVLQGFQLRSEPATTHDNTGANNLKMFCSSTHGMIEGDGTPWGGYTDQKHCPGRSGICGFKTQVDTTKGVKNKDSTGLNNVKFLCCPLPKSCISYKTWEQVLACSNVENNTITCNPITNGSVESTALSISIPKSSSTSAYFPAIEYKVGVRLDANYSSTLFADVFESRVNAILQSGKQGTTVLDTFEELINGDTWKQIDFIVNSGIKKVVSVYLKFCKAYPSVSIATKMETFEINTGRRIGYSAMGATP